MLDLAFLITAKILLLHSVMNTGSLPEFLPTLSNCYLTHMLVSNNFSRVYLSVCSGCNLLNNTVLSLSIQKHLDHNKVNFSTKDTGSRSNDPVKGRFPPNHRISRVTIRLASTISCQQELLRYQECEPHAFVNGNVQAFEAFVYF